MVCPVGTVSRPPSCYSAEEPVSSPSVPSPHGWVRRLVAATGPAGPGHGGDLQHRHAAASIAPSVEASTTPRRQLPPRAVGTTLLLLYYRCVLLLYEHKQVIAETLFRGGSSSHKLVFFSLIQRVRVISMIQRTMSTCWHAETVNRYVHQINYCYVFITKQLPPYSLFLC
jgi:hypothetical protein